MGTMLALTTRLMSVPISIRPAHREELRALAEAVAPQPLFSRYGLSAEKLAQDLDGAHAQGEELLVAEDAQGAVGLAWYLQSGGFGLGGYLKLIALVPGTEGRGVGRALLDEVERRVGEHKRHLFLLVSHWNEGARRFYRQRGYDEVGLLPKLLRHDTDEVICHKRLR
jgi:ribosomal protein S18 acetylase RimI-like enzyme